jgi:hypothetical protein
MENISKRLGPHHKLLSCAVTDSDIAGKEEKVEVVIQCNGVRDITAMKTGE